MAARSRQQPTPPAKKSFSLISDQKLIRLYAAMLQCRMLDERARTFSRHRKFSGNNRSAAGQEAAIVAAVIDLLPTDTIAPSDCDLIAGFVKGVPLKDLFCRLSARSKMEAASSFAIGIATGMALANKRDNNIPITVSFCDAGATPPSSWPEVLNYAGTNKLPILFVCQSNSHAEDIALTAQACGVPGITVDGNDVVAVYRVACEAIAHARRGHGPTLIECRAWRLNERSSIHLGKQSNSEKVRAAIDNNPILNMERYLAGKGLFRKQLKAEIVADFKKNLDAAVRVAAKSLVRKRVK